MFIGIPVELLQRILGIFGKVQRADPIQMIFVDEIIDDIFIQLVPFFFQQFFDISFLGL